MNQHVHVRLNDGSKQVLLAENVRDAEHAVEMAMGSEGVRVALSLVQSEAVVVPTVFEETNRPGDARA